MPQAHDRFVKELLSHPERAATLLRERLPKEIVKFLSGKSPEPVPGSFVDQQLREHLNLFISRSASQMIQMTAPRKSRLLILLLYLFALSGFAAEQVKYRLFLQVSEDSVDKLNLALDNAHNVQMLFGPENIEIEIVVFGRGVNTLKHYAPIPIAHKVKAAKYAGVRIVACENSMRTYKLRPSDMLPEARYVEAGVMELVEKQTEGWSYVRP
uniref:Transposase (putative) YhgA-like domain-containing protein n=1 Tax=Candidatus Kentrum sp. LPFa TaxID=2126335 RepID=A0A450WI81_9GAMM|nr:MAG: hypothetical protein BECKLPF1236A_GA0070988_101538 [Candidatus Kentron sp. LPFa]VFK32197.1 MAG: hypothetical protein BECKLPF1236C_GA0070990_101608 [Candidatus Kentron sp. LPFa]